MFSNSNNKLIFTLYLLYGILAGACTSPSDDRMYPIGPNVEADIIIFFNTNVTEEEINLFDRNVISKPHPEGRGYYLIDGVIDVLRLQSVQNHAAIAIRFSAKATQEQRTKVRSAIISSPIVYKIKENVVPKEIKTVE